MPFKAPDIPKDMSAAEYQEICFLEQLLAEPLDVLPPVRKKAFLSPNEIKLFGCLTDWFPKFIVLTQVHLLQMINVDKQDIDQTFMQNYEHAFGSDAQKAYWTVFNMVSLLSVDFVLAEKDGNPIYAIELDGPEHKTDEKLIQRDKIKAHVLNVISVPLLKIKNGELASLDQLKLKVLNFAQ